MESLAELAEAGAFEDFVLEGMVDDATAGDRLCMTVHRTHTLVVFLTEPGATPRVLHRERVPGEWEMSWIGPWARAIATQHLLNANVDLSSDPASDRRVRGRAWDYTFNYCIAALRAKLPEDQRGGFALLLPDIVWARRFPAVLGPLVGIYRENEWHSLCCAHNVAACVADIETPWRQALLDAAPTVPAWSLAHTMRCDIDANDPACIRGTVVDAGACVRHWCAIMSPDLGGGRFLARPLAPVRADTPESAPHLTSPAEAAE